MNEDELTALQARMRSALGREMSLAEIAATRNSEGDAADRAA